MREEYSHIFGNRVLNSIEGLLSLASCVNEAGVVSNGDSIELSKTGTES